MIVDRLSYLLKQHPLDSKIYQGVHFLENTDFSEQSVGVHEVDDEIFYVVAEYETKGAEECFWEAHQKYLDLHYIIEGSEQIGYEQIERLTVKEAYNEEKDAEFFSGEVNSAVAVYAGDVLVCYPQDGHMTGIAIQEKVKVRKVILKVKI
ncbi:YhcH/YjgK/YiaL family protein [Paenibacillus sp. DS2015]|uniref:YhcH/YjgK/YiaL family protein n=1 Tax=Paenibacillus sp. DS2015 TaxID=3373917 RepID=UPI003D19F7FB